MSAVPPPRRLRRADHDRRPGHGDILHPVLDAGDLNEADAHEAMRGSLLKSGPPGVAWCATPGGSMPLPLATIIFEFLFCASAQGEDSKEKKGCGGKEEWKENPFVNFGTKAPQALRHGSADCPWSIRCRGYGFLRGRPGFLFGRVSRAAFFGSTAGLKSGYFAM